MFMQLDYIKRSKPHSENGACRIPKTGHVEHFYRGEEGAGNQTRWGILSAQTHNEEADSVPGAIIHAQDPQSTTTITKQAYPTGQLPGHEKFPIALWGSTWCRQRSICRLGSLTNRNGVYFHRVAFSARYGHRRHTPL